MGNKPSFNYKYPVITNPDGYLMLAQLWCFDPIEQEETYFDINPDDRGKVEFNLTSSPFDEQCKFAEHVVVPLMKQR